MSLLKRFDFEQVTSDQLLNSISEQISVLFSNRVDNYWIYDFENRKLFAIHEIFKLDKFSDSFLEKLSYGIQIWDTRIKKCLCFLNLNNPNSPFLEIKFTLKRCPLSIFSLNFSLDDL